MSKQQKASMGVDARGQRILHFQTEAQNLSRLSLLLDLIVEMFESGDWRSYSTALGREVWRACEFDYFLIASGISYTDAARVFSWRDRGRALTAATMSDDPQKRRSLEQASNDWHAPTPETLAERAERLGWIHARGIKSPAPARARAYVQHGVSRDVQAQRHRQHQVKGRRTELDQLVADLTKRVPDEAELRYIVDRLRERLAKHRQHGKAGRPRSDREQWGRDIAAFKGNAKALAQHWGMTERGARMRKAEVKSRLNFRKKAS